MIPMTTLRRGSYRVKITVDLLVAPHLTPGPDPHVHGVAIRTFLGAMAEKDLPVDMARTSVVLTTDTPDDLAGIGQKVYVWTFTFPVPLFHPTQ